MQNFIKNKRWIGLVAGFTIVTACNDFEELNTDPTRMTRVDVASLLTQTVYDAGTRSSSYDDIGNYIGQYWTNTSLIDQRHRYDFRGSDSEAVYEDIYGTLYDIQDLKQRAKQEGLNDYRGAGLVLEAYLTTYLTDVFGPVPYSEALEGDALNFTPKFDSQESIYRANLDSLDRAYDLLATRPGGNFIRQGDPFYFGDNLRWRKLANSLKLRMYMKMVDVDPSVVAEIASLIDGGELISSAEESAAIIYDGRYGLEATRNNGTAESVALAETFAEVLQVHLDPRRPQIAAVGENQDGSPVLDGQGNPVYRGVPTGEEPDIIRSFEGLAAPYTGFNGETAPSILYSYAEVEFYIAEAILQGYVSGDAAAHYQAGIRASCERWGVDDAAIEAFLAREDIALAEDTDQALRQVWEQEYVNFYDQGYDGWLHYRRVEYPEFHVGSAMLTDEIMRRMVYPPLLKSINQANYTEAVNSLDQGDNLLSSGWWSE